MLGVDFGGTRIKAAEVRDGALVRTHVVDTPPGAAPAEVLDAVAGAVVALEAEPTVFGLAIPGEVDATGRCWRLPNVAGFENVQIARELGVRTGARVFVENDGTTAALAESLFGHGREHASFLMVTLGTGIGGGLVIGRRVIRGAHGFAAEVGHVTIDRSPDAWPCVCGQVGCVEAYAGTRGLLRRFGELGGKANEISEVAASARAGHKAGQEAFFMMARALAVALNSIQNVLDLDAIVFTGGISRSFDLIEPALRAELRRRAFAPPLAEVPLLVSELGDLAGVMGAAHLPAALM
jgi:glucokinase